MILPNSQSLLLLNSQLHILFTCSTMKVLTDFNSEGLQSKPQSATENRYFYVWALCTEDCCPLFWQRMSMLCVLGSPPPARKRIWANVVYPCWPSGPVQLHQRGQFHLRSGRLTFNLSAKPAETKCKKSPPPSIIFEGGDFQADRVCEAKISMIWQACWT